jgi:hypothetical protein
VVIALPGTFTVTLDTTFVASSITVGSGSGAQTLALTNRTLTINKVLLIRNGGVFASTNSNLVGAGGITNQGTLVVYGNSNTIAGQLTTTSGSLLHVEGNSNVGPAILTVVNGFTNVSGAAIELTSVTQSWDVALGVTTGTLTNAGTITSLVGTGGRRVLNATLNNQGTLTVASGGTGRLSITGAFANSGAVNIKLGGTTAGAPTNGYDQLAVSGATAFGTDAPEGTLAVTLTNGFSPATGQNFDVITFATSSSDFATYTLPPGNWTHTAGPSGQLRLTAQ